MKRFALTIHLLLLLALSPSRSHAEFLTIITDIGSVHEECCPGDTGHLLTEMLVGTDAWWHMGGCTTGFDYHYFVVDLAVTKTLQQVRAWSDGTNRDPCDVDIYVDDGADHPSTAGIRTGTNPAIAWGAAVNSSAFVFDDHDHDDRVTLDTTDKDGRWILVVVNQAEPASNSLCSVNQRIKWARVTGGAPDPSPGMEFDLVDAISEITRTMYDPDTDQAVTWDTFGGGATHYERVAKGSGTGEGVETGTSGEFEQFEWPAMSPAGEILALRIWTRGTRYSTGELRNVKLSYKSMFESEGFPFTNGDEYSYVEFAVNPEDGTPWETADLTAVRGGVKSVGTSIGNGGGKVAELWIELIHAPDSTWAYMTHGTVTGGVKDDEIRVWCRTSNTAKVRIMYGPDESDVQASTPSSLVGSTLITDDPGSDNTFSISDYTVVIPITSLSANVRYYLNPYVDGEPVDEFEGAPFWTSLPSCQAFPTEGVWANFDYIFGGDYHSHPVNHLISASMMNIAGITPRFILDLGDHHAENTDSLNDFFNTASGFSPHSHRGGYKGGFKMRRGYNVSAKFLTRELYSKIPLVLGRSDHDFVCDNSSKNGLKQSTIYAGGNAFIDTATHELTDVIHLDVNNATYGNVSTVSLETTPAKVVVHSENFTIEISGAADADSNGTFHATVLRNDTAFTVFSLAKAGDDTPLDFEQANCTFCIVKMYFDNTYNAQQAFVEYAPTYDFIPPDDLAGTATGGSTTTLVDATLLMWQLDYDTLSGGTPAVDDDIDINGDDGALIYVDPTDGTTGTMIVLMDAEAEILDGETVQVEGGGSWSCTIDADTEHLGWPIESIYGIYPGRVIHHFQSDGSRHAVGYFKSAADTTMTLYRALNSVETFENTDTYIVQLGGINRTFMFGNAEIILFGLRYLSDEKLLAGINGYDMLDGTRTYVDHKNQADTTADASTDLDTVYLSTIEASIVVGSVLHNSTEDLWAIISSVESGFVELDREIAGQTVGNTVFIYESGASDHGSDVANINNGHVRRTQFLNAINDSTADRIYIGMEMPIHSLLAKDEGDKWSEVDPLDAQRQFLIDNITQDPDTLLILSADRHDGSLYDGRSIENPFVSAGASPFYCEYATQPLGGNHKPDSSWTLDTDDDGEADFYSGWGRDEGDTNAPNHNFGAFGIIEARQLQSTVTLHNPDGTVLSNYRIIEETNRVITAITADTDLDGVAVGFTKVGFSVPGWDPFVAGPPTVQGVTGYVAEITYNATTDLYPIHINDADELVFQDSIADLITDGVETGDTINIYNLMWMEDALPMAGNLTMFHPYVEPIGGALFYYYQQLMSRLNNEKNLSGSDLIPSLM